MKNKQFTIIAFVMAFIYWFIEGSIHYFIFEEPEFEFIPHESHEIWMRIVITFLIMLLGIYADSFIHKIVLKQLEVAGIYHKVIHTSHQTLDNLLQQMQLFRMEALKSADFDRDVFNYFDNAIQQASDLIVTLSKVEKVTKEIEGVGDE
jgi:hypothetical protein